MYKCMCSSSASFIVVAATNAKRIKGADHVSYKQTTARQRTNERASEGMKERGVLVT